MRNGTASGNPWMAVVQMAYGYMDVDASLKRHRTYVKRQRRAAGKRDLLQWRSVEMHADEYREAQERRKQKAESTQKPHTTSSGYSRRFENEWRAFEKKYQARYEYRCKQESYARRERAADDDPTVGATGQTDNRGDGESESARYRRQFWSNTWRGFGGGADWNFGANPSWETPYQGRDSNKTVGSPADRLVLGLSPVGPLSLEELKIAFRQCALSWHPDRHDGHLKHEAEAKFKRVGDAYRTLRGLL
ncbi:uncharacterized protein [Physcomitrium patens]|uniref:J domain-containing protein n=1 Tax=Physcomitrium patens TaxID=3218 RepID=A0A7I4EM16_PHYPA|nr:uncharacterized protein LOC112286978 isoform X2 [Physcomitrium patens]|eukprot:XP_024385271.1 uncharacterized protein LOC112286978 isoform X2 [Physcomitrella patens]